MLRPWRVLAIAASLGLITSCTPSVATTSVAATDPAQADGILKIVRDDMTAAHLKAVILRVTVDGKEIVTAAEGESMTGVPATTDMHFRNGAVAISYVATLLLELVDEHKISLDDKLSKYLPDMPHANEVTIGELAQMTSGYQDYVLGNQEFAKIAYANPFMAWTTDDQLNLAIHKPLWYAPGTNWNYAHTNYVILGLVLEKVTGESMADLLQQKVLGPLGLTNTTPNLTAAIPEPALHAYTSERRSFFNIPAKTPFYEDSTYWNPSWTINHGAIETTNIFDLEKTAVAIGTGKLLSPQSFKDMTTTDLRGRTRPVAGCGNCRELNNFATYGLGLWITGDWYFQNPLFYGYSAVDAYLPAQKIAIAVTVTYQPEAFNSDGQYSNGADTLFRKIGAYLAPNDAPPTQPGK
jgi:CubicO group peptidase (beta-lactamase class C family)